MKRKDFSFSIIFCSMILSVSLFTGCFGDDDKTDTPVTPTAGDTTAPTVSSTSPADGDGPVNPSSISVTFSEAMTTSTITGSTDGSCTGSIQVSRNSFSTCVQFTSATATSSSGDTVFTLTVSGTLDGLSTYKIKVTNAAQDAASNALAQVYEHATGFTTP